MVQFDERDQTEWRWLYESKIVFGFEDVVRKRDNFVLTMLFYF